ncbi:MAG: CPXCG motif-containing cysteine-rich protein [Calditrichaeota bacterium]|nr:MAG: CPXCG motif-containing cysteine-rich protein [Calditrichota bacterium]
MQDTVEVLCPYCGQRNEIFIDYSAGQHQSYVEDCQVCCRSWRVIVVLTEEEPMVNVQSIDD